MCSQEWKINPRHQRILHNGADVFDTSSLNELGIDHTSILKLMVRGQGGAGFIPFRKPHLKREDAITYMKEEQKKALETKPELVVPDADLPDNFRQFLHGEKSKMDDILTLKTRLGGEFMKSPLRQVSLETLATIKKLFESNRGKKGEKNLTIPEKIEKTVRLIYPQVALMDKCCNKLFEFQNDRMKDLMSMFCDESNTYSEEHGSANIDIQKFVASIQKEIDRRDDRPVSDDAVGNTCRFQ